ncbi:MAG TPA: adenosine deaminase [Bdellovibrionales bacterium]|nr:adenosine deaminase [Bdellovibrionales bacterium]
MTASELRKIPKVELHRHLDCSMRLSTMRELAREAGLEVPEAPEAFAEKYLVTTPMVDLEAVLNKFLATQKILSSEAILERLGFEAVEDAFEEGIRILELRYAPTFIAEGHPHLTFDKIHAALVRGVDRARAKFPVKVGLIAIIQRILPVSVAASVTDFAIANRDTFVGLDLADNEVGFDAKPFAKHFERAKAAGLHITIHSGEANFPEAPQRVREAVELLGAERIGHGIQIFRDPKVMEFMAKNEIPLEVCPTSNWLTNAVASVKEHPIRKLMNNGVLCTINTDDPGVFAFDMIHEYEALQREQGFTLADFERCNTIAEKHSFL